MTSLKQTHEEEKRRVQYVNSSLIEDLSHTRLVVWATIVELLFLCMIMYM